MDLLSQRNRREDEGRRKDTCVFRHGDCTLPAEMLSWQTLRSVTSGEGEQMGLSTPQKYATAIGG